MKNQIYRRMLALAILIALLTSGAMLALRVRDGLHELSEQTSRQAAIAAAGYLTAADPDEALHAIGNSDTSRVTMISADGTVLYDSNADAATMENHSNRPEFEAARETGTGEGIRISSTLDELTCYVALRLPSGDVLRVANTTDLLVRSLIDTIPAMVVVIIIICLLSAFVSARLTEQLVRPINAIDPTKPLKTDVYDELTPLLRRLNAQNQQISLQIAALRRKQIEFDAITAGMDEGLILLDEHLSVLTCSRAARRLLDAPVAPGLPLDSFECDEAILHAAQIAQAGESTVYTLERAGNQLRLSFSPVHVDDGIRGVVMLVLDISSQYAAEQSRRMFTANVTHELKTPLTSVLGYAEMIRYGLAKPEDVPGFACRIHDEAARLLALVDDIMKLSRLDEGRGSLNFEDIDLYELAGSVCERMSDKAAKHQVRFAMHGAPCVIRGIPTMVDEVVTNLCDNAIKYNRPGGTVDIELKKTSSSVILRVANTGAAIPADSIPHIFERFYRADASRSREVPGTGLGLSIVKHICEIHSAVISVTSESDNTVFTGQWPSDPGVMM